MMRGVKRSIGKIMNKQIEAYARKTLKEGLRKCTAKQRLFFKRMYSHLNLSKRYDTVVNEMPADKLDWAMQQVQQTIDK